MTTATLPLSTGLSATRPARKSLLRRAYDALIEARMRRATREIAMHRHLLPKELLERARPAGGLANDRGLPFTRAT
jgi:hypothetical protein